MTLVLELPASSASIGTISTALGLFPPSPIPPNLHASRHRLSCRRVSNPILRSETADPAEFPANSGPEWKTAPENPLQKFYSRLGSARYGKSRWKSQNT
jgi:hypothetical protein